MPQATREARAWRLAVKVILVINVGGNVTVLMVHFAIT